MHYPVMTEKQVAVRWQLSLKTQRWQLDNEGPVWHKLFHYARYYEADILELVRQPSLWTVSYGSTPITKRENITIKKHDRAQAARAEVISPL